MDLRRDRLRSTSGAAEATKKTNATRERFDLIQTKNMRIIKSNIDNSNRHKQKANTNIKKKKRTMFFKGLIASSLCLLQSFAGKPRT